MSAEVKRMAKAEWKASEKAASELLTRCCEVEMDRNFAELI